MKTDVLTDETPIYKYMALNSFLDFYMYDSIMFQRIKNWPDHREGSLYAILDTNKKKSMHYDDYFGCSWTFDTEDRRLYGSNENRAYELACEELTKNGSAAMWESYCKNGGVRVRTTIGKVKQLLGNYPDFLDGSVHYNPKYISKMYDKNATIKDVVFYKNVSFRYEHEYRFVFPNITTDDIIKIRIQNMREFIDEMLISPTTKQNRWITDAIFKLAWSNPIVSPFDPKLPQNVKNGKRYCRTSNLYGEASEELRK